ncbi:3980_t:CDS:2 [Ambispora leptoticha]|uniref:3980_t:CDS:1 n=1 Tax=Ambispora leptoticha TaxID=144679 RepID=A0A9N9GKZ3_9GLOM|nr:3980_t:CDS:2 [Ambispora leptoticha]
MSAYNEENPLPLYNDDDVMEINSLSEGHNLNSTKATIDDILFLFHKHIDSGKNTTKTAEHLQRYMTVQGLCLFKVWNLEITVFDALAKSYLGLNIFSNTFALPILQRDLIQSSSNVDSPLTYTHFAEYTDGAANVVLSEGLPIVD